MTSSGDKCIYIHTYTHTRVRTHTHTHTPCITVVFLYPASFSIYQATFVSVFVLHVFDIQHNSSTYIHYSITYTRHPSLYQISPGSRAQGTGHRAQGTGHRAGAGSVGIVYYVPTAALCTPFYYVPTAALCTYRSSLMCTIKFTAN